MINAFMRHIRWFALCLMGLAIWTSSAHAQQTLASLEFSEDSVALGMPTELVMRIQHDEDVEVMFPNRQEYFAPFEQVGKEVSPMRIRDSIAREVVVFSLRTFELVPKQSVRLPYWYVAGRDTFQKWIASDTVVLKQQIETVSDSLNYRVGEKLIAFQKPFNWPVLLLVLGVCAIVGLGIIAFLRKPVERFLALRRLRRKQLAMQARIRDLVHIEHQPDFFESLTGLWKGYFDPQDQIGLRSMTTTELSEQIHRLRNLTHDQQEMLVKTSHAADQVIYAGNTYASEELETFVWELEQVMDYVFELKEAEIKKRK
ncbi:hypothetical protein [Pontibacter sp. G13]|uniref:hypothetical protein n=1 Tax=Pontibacter sp. G13 TaxID=3074898 RepID=UPI00288C2C4A|nr:hypothetical protein [Pontibacter sp. G13]WNJ16549.1 hypothetical protein RJD25_16915 [Pontibacter sp. G13]